MRTSFTLILLASLASFSTLSTGCSKKDEAGSSAAKATAGKGIDYGDVDKKLAAAKSSDDYLEVIMACAGLEMDAAMSGNSKLSKDPTHLEHCKYAVEVKRANQVVAESTPDKGSVMCISASMNLDELVEAGGPRKAEFAALRDKVNKACDI